MTCCIAAVWLLMAGCSRDNVATELDIGSIDPTDSPESTLQKISLNVTSTKTCTFTRGSGTIGGVEGEDEGKGWSGEHVNVFMLDKGTLNATKSDDDAVIYYDSVMITPTAGTKGLASYISDDIKYYPLQGSSDFCGYYLDDDARNGDLINDGKILRVPLKIDGSQDVLAGATDRDKDYENASDTSKVKISDLYSSKSSAYGIRPNIVFKHQLTRLRFYACAGDEKSSESAYTIPLDNVEGGVDGLDDNDKNKYDNQPLGFTISTGVYIDAIRVYSAYTGDMVVAYTDSTDSQRIIWTTDSVLLSVKENNTNPFASTLVPYTSESKSASESKSGKALGDALFVSPSPYGRYRIEMDLHQYVKSKEDWWIAEDPVNRKQTYILKKIKYPLEGVKYINIDPNNNFSSPKDIRGYSFNLNLTLWGMERIDVSSTLDTWENGDKIVEDKSIE